MTAAISVGGVDVLTDAFSEWAYPRFGSLVGILSDGTSVDNEVLQSSGMPRRQATLSGWLQDRDDLDTLNAYNATKEIVSVVDADGETRDASILDLKVARVLPGAWSCSITLVDYGIGGS